jgi:hypothetical protein
VGHCSDEDLARGVLGGHRDQGTTGAFAREVAIRRVGAVERADITAGGVELIDLIGTRPIRDVDGAAVVDREPSQIAAALSDDAVGDGDLTEVGAILVEDVDRAVAAVEHVKVLVGLIDGYAPRGGAVDVGTE